MRKALPRKRWAWPATLLMICALFGAMPTAADAQDSFDPPVVTVTLGAGESITIDKTLHLDAAPEFADIVIAIDTTGSMGTAIAQAQAEAIQICNDVKAQIPGARFAAVDFEDYPTMPDGLPTDNPYILLTPGFVADCATFAAAIGTMAAESGAGGDFAEAYNRAFFEAYSDPLLVYNPQAVRFLVVLGDAPPHDATQTAAPACGDRPPTDFGRDNVGGTPDDIESEAAVAGLVANNITLLMIRYNDFIPLGCFQELANPTGGQAVDAGGAGTLSGIIVALVEEESAEIDEVRLVVSAGCPLAISFNPPNPPPYGPFTAPVDIQFEETITAPTVPGGYACTVTAIVDGVQRAVQIIQATVTAGAAATLDLEPAADTNPVDSEHCLTATVRDEFGNPNSGVTVRFSVTPTAGRSPSSGADVTDASGRADFCYSSAFPGADVINAYADLNNNNVQDPGEPFDAATKVWTLPASTEGCKVTYGGRITAANGDKATFGGNAKVKNDGTVQGQEQYQDHGPVQPMNVHSINVLALVCPDTSPLEASIFGDATIDGSGSVLYRIDVKDVDEPGTGVDTYRIRLSNGYDSGEQVLRGGNIQIHK